MDAAPSEMKYGMHGTVQVVVSPELLRMVLLLGEGSTLGRSPMKAASDGWYIHIEM